MLLGMTRAFGQICFQKGNLWFEITSVNTVSVFMKSACYSDPKIPATITFAGKQYTVTAIKSKGFERYYARELAIPNTVTTIGDSIFFRSTMVESLTIPRFVTKIGTDAFLGARLKSLVVEEGNRFYDSRNNCNALIDSRTNTLLKGSNKAFIPNGVRRIENYAFLWCDDIAEINMPNTVTDIGKGAFSSVPIGNIVLPNGLKTIGDHAFSGCSLCSLKIPASVTAIGKAAFAGNKISSIVVESGNKVYDSRNNCNAIIETKTNTLLNACQNTTIPNSVRTIGEYSFGFLRGLESVMIPASVTEIKDCAFNTCRDLRDVKIMGTVNFGNDCFVFCDSLKKMTYLTPLVLQPVNLGGYCNIDTLYVLRDMVPMFKQTDLWKNIPNILPYTLPVDVNTDGIVNSTDVVALYNIIGKGGGDAEQKLRADVNGDGTINSADVVTVYNYIVDGK